MVWGLEVHTKGKSVALADPILDTVIEGQLQSLQDVPDIVNKLIEQHRAQSMVSRFKVQGATWIAYFQESIRVRGISPLIERIKELDMDIPVSL